MTHISIDSTYFLLSRRTVSGASIAHGRPPLFGGALLAPSLRSRWDRIGQKPEPTIRRGMTRKSLPPRVSIACGKLGGPRSGGRSPRDLQFARILLSRALPQSFATQNPAPSRREPFISSLRQKNTTKEIFLVVFVFSPLKMHSRDRLLLFYSSNSDLRYKLAFLLIRLDISRKKMYNAFDIIIEEDQAWHQSFSGSSIFYTL